MMVILLQGRGGLALKSCTRSPGKSCTGWKSLWLLGIGPSMLATMTGWRWDGDFETVFDCSPRGNNSCLIILTRSRKEKRIDSELVSSSPATPPLETPSVLTLALDGRLVTQEPPTWASQPSETRDQNMMKLYILPRDLDQDENNTTHCANATFINPGANRWE